MTDFEKALRNLINSESMENGSNTPDFILARFLSRVLDDFDQAVVERERWYKPNEDVREEVKP